MTNLWRVHLKTSGETAGKDPRRFCIEGRIVGIGWQVEHDGEVDRETYERLARAEYQSKGKGWITAWNAFYHRMEIDDLCWTRDLHGIYYLGRVSSDWRYENDKQHRDVDVVNVRGAEWVTIGTADKVPGTVLRRFIGGPTVQSISDSTTVTVSQLLYNRKSKREVYKVSRLEDADLYQLLRPPDLENLVALYLQSQGYMVVPRTADDNAPKYEFALIHRDDGRRAVLQVKSGSVNLRSDDYAEVADMVDELFLFTSGGTYEGETSPKIRYLYPETIKAFAHSHYRSMPDPIQVCIDLVGELDTYAISPG